MKYTYNKKQYNEYVRNCKKWLTVFGITEWEIDYKHHKLDTAATTTYNNVAKIACFQLTTEGDGDFCLQTDLNRLACHEVIHLLLADLGFAIHETKDYCSDLAISREHEVVMRLLNVLCK